MLKRAVCLLCCAALAFMAPFSAQAADTYRMAGFDGDNSNHTWADNAFFTRMQERTGLGFTFDEYTDYTKWQAAKQQMFASGNLPDVLFKAELTTKEQMTYAESGQLIDLKPLLAENAPNLWALLEAHPDWLSAITLPDGKIVALPGINELPAQNAMWINKTWLDALHLSAPTDFNSLLAVLRAFKTGDPNGNGAADEIPLTFLGPWDLKFFEHAFGMVANDYNVYLNEDGTVGFAPEQDGYLAMLAALSDMYAEGLLDSNGFFTSDAFRTITDSKAAATYGMFFGPNPVNLLPYETSAQYELLLPLRYNDRQMYRDLNGQLMLGTFAITSACDNPAALLKWVDVLYTQDGAVEAMAGKQGQDYAFSEDGRWSYLGDMQSLSSYILYSLSIYDSGNMPWLFPLSFYNHYSNDSIEKVNTQLAQLQNFIVKPFPAYTLTPAQEDELAPLQNDLGRYVDESMAKFVLGEWNIHDATAVEAYQTGLNEHGKAALVAFWQGIANSLAK